MTAGRGTAALPGSLSWNGNANPPKVPPSAWSRGCASFGHFRESSLLAPDPLETFKTVDQLEGIEGPRASRDHAPGLIPAFARSELKRRALGLGLHLPPIGGHEHARRATDYLCDTRVARQIGGN